MTAPTFPPIEERHEASRRAYLARDLAGYMGHFAPDLVYTQADGKTITLAQLSSQVAEQLRRFSTADWTSRVESEERNGDTVVEVISQKGTFTATAFGIIHRAWDFERRGRYTWKPLDGRWRIVEVRVLEEKISTARTRFGR